MGTNYYLYKKAHFKKEFADNTYRSFGCDEGLNDLVQRISNGYVYNNTYYKTVEDLDKDYFERYHIGKQSCGWAFLLATYPERGINTIEDYLKLFKDPNNYIEDEYGETVNPEYLIKLFKTGCPWNGNKTERHQDAKQVNRNGWHIDILESGNDPAKYHIFC